MTEHDEKAKELIDKYEEITNSTNEAAIQCALIAVDEILGITDTVWVGSSERGGLESSIDFEFWNGVRESILKYQP